MSSPVPPEGAAPVPAEPEPADPVPAEPEPADPVPAEQSLAGPEARAAAFQAQAGPETIERLGRPMRHFAVAISSEAMALAWANQENAPQGAAVLVDHEINPRGLHGRLWDTPQPDTLACSVVLRPPISVEEGDVSWLIAALAGAEAAQEASGLTVATWWPDQIVEADTRDPIGAVRAEIQLGPGKIKAAVITVRLDLVRLELDADEGRDRLLEALVGSVDRHSESLAEGTASVVAAYEQRCGVVGQRVKIRLRPKGETRGVARHLDRAGRLEVESMSGMIERVGVDQLMELEVVQR